MTDVLDDKTGAFTEYYGTRVIVLGAAGFIGRWVARLLTASGARLFLPVRDPSGAERVFEKFSIDGEIYNCDLCDSIRLNSIYRTACPSITFNLAGYGVDREERNEKTAYQVNADLLGVICKAISEIRDDSWTGLDIVNAGSAMEYGQASGDLCEDSVPLPTTLYGRSKLAGTRSLAKACNEFGLKGLTARLFSVYGPGEPDWRLLPTLIRSAGEDEPICLTAGTHKRDFVYIEDVAEALLRLGLSLWDRDRAVNVATGDLSTVRSFVEMAATVLDIGRDRLRFGTLPVRAEEMAHEPVSLERLRTLTGHIPGTSMASGIRKAIDLQSSPRFLNSGNFFSAETGATK